MKKTKFMSLVAILLMFVVALTCGFLFACSGGEEEEPETEPEIVDPDPTTDPNENENENEGSEGENDEDEVTVKIYTDATTFDGSEVEFQNEYELTITESAGEDGNKVYAISGTATMMSAEQAVAFGGDATTDDAFIVYEIYAPVGYTVVCGEKSTVIDETGSEIYIQGMRAESTTTTMSFAVYENEGDEVAYAEFVISLEEVSFPAVDPIIGTWSNSIEATAVYNTQTYTATADIELTFAADQTFTLVITNISTGDESIDGLIALFVSKIEMKGAWSVSEGTYTIKFDEYDNESTLTIDEETGAIGLSFSITYSVFNMIDLDITVENQTLIPGTLAENASDPEE